MTAGDELAQHPVTRIQSLIEELKDTTQNKDYEHVAIHQMLSELETLLVMLATKDDRSDIAYKAHCYDRIAAMIAAAPRKLESEGTSDVDSDAANRRGNRHR